MFRTIIGKIPQDKDLPERAYKLTILNHLLNGSIYDHLRYEFHQERLDGDYAGMAKDIRLEERKPCVTIGTGLLKSVVDDSTSLLFGEGRFPAIDVNSENDSETLREIIQTIVKESKLVEVMKEAAYKGSVGSIVVWMRVLKNRLFFDVLDTRYLTPTFDPEEPDCLIEVKEQYKVKGAALKAQGYKIPDDNLSANFWFQRIFCQEAETWFVPWLCSEEDDYQPAIDTDPTRTRQHNLGFCPMVWIRNLPGGNKVDGLATFQAGIETCVELDYLASQNIRSLKYSADPTLLVKDPLMGSGGNVMTGSGTAIIVPEGGDAKLLEINGTSSAAMVEQQRALREAALEALHGNRINPDKVTMPHSGEAQKMMWAPMVMVADNLRSSYGEHGLLKLIQLVLKASTKVAGGLKIGGKMVKDLNPDTMLTLKWPDFFPPTALDRNNIVQALQLAVDNSLMSREEAVKNLAGIYNVEDIDKELRAIESDIIAADARDKALQANITLSGDAKTS